MSIIAYTTCSHTWSGARQKSRSLTVVSGCAHRCGVSENRLSTADNRGISSTLVLEMPPEKIEEVTCDLPLRERFARCRWRRKLRSAFL